MSTRCALMSSRPSSNTANSPIGPAPMMSASVLMASLMPASALPLRRRHDKAVERVGHLDLAGQPRVRPHVEGKIQHVLFHRRGLAGLLPPRLVDIDVAGRARAGAAAFGLDAGHAVLDRRLHDG